jgi:hypothetical protein
MEDLKINGDELKAVVFSTLQEKVVQRYSYVAIDRIIDNLVAEQRQPLETFIRDALKFVTSDKKFQAAVREEFQHKVAKAMVGKLEGTVERAVDAIRQNQTLRAEMILAIERIIQKA